MANIDELKAELEAMTKADLVDYALTLEKRAQMLDALMLALPPCPEHGIGCIPHAVTWASQASRYKAFTEKVVKTCFDMERDRLSIEVRASLLALYFSELALEGNQLLESEKQTT